LFVLDKNHFWIVIFFRDDTAADIGTVQLQSKEIFVVVVSSTNLQLSQLVNALGIHVIAWFSFSCFQVLLVLIK